MEFPPGLLEPATMQRYLGALAGKDVSRHLRICDLQTGDSGVIEAIVAGVDPIRPFARKRGGEGMRGRATLTDPTGDIDLVLWDDETRFVRDGTLATGKRIRISGATVKAGFRRGLELGLGAATIEAVSAIDDGAEHEIAGTMLELGAARIVGERPNVRIQADLVLATLAGTARIALEGEIVKSIRPMPLGQQVRIGPVRTHPVLDGWYLAGPDCHVRI